jgi:hypothetical protein
MQALVARVHLDVHHIPAFELNIAYVPSFTLFIAFEDKAALLCSNEDQYLIAHMHLLSSALPLGGVLRLSTGPLRVSETE